MQIVPTDDPFFFWADLIFWTLLVLIAFLPFILWRQERVEQIRTRDLKTLAAMKRAFRWGSKTSHTDYRRPAAIYAMEDFAKKEADAAQRAEIALLMRGAISKILQQEDVNFLLTNRLPRRLATRFMGWFSKIEQPLIRSVSIALWRFFSDVDLSDAAASRFRSLHDKRRWVFCSRGSLRR